MRGETYRQPPWKHIAADFYYSVTAVQIDEVDWELHAEGVHGFTGEYPQTFARRKPLAPQQTLSTLCAFVGDFHVAGEQRLASEVRDPQARVGSCPAVLSEAVQ
jgi:hypothetical protein